MIPAEPVLFEFGPFRLDAAERLLLRDGQEVPLRDKVFELLLLLVRRRGQLVTKAELLELLWPGTTVQENNLTVAISFLRKALGPERGVAPARARRRAGAPGSTESEPSYIRTVARHGYRFVADVREGPRLVVGGRVDAPESAGEAPPASLPASLTASLPLPPERTWVAREPELMRLHALAGRAQGGRGRLVWLSGSAGMGKTALIERFCAELEGASGWVLARGRCLEHYGAREPYLPFLEALTGLMSSGAGPALGQLLAQHAPSWCGHFAQTRAARASSVAAALPTTSHGMLRELRDALVALAAISPVLLVLEDLQWADASSSALVQLLGQSGSAARLLVLASLRAEPAELGDQPLKNARRELLAHDQCEEIALGCLDAAQVEAYLAQLGGGPAPAELAAWLLAQTEGQPLFLTRIVSLLIETGALRIDPGGLVLTRELATLHPSLPDSVRGVIERKLDSLAPEERRALAHASVQGEELSSLVLAETLEADELELEQWLDAAWRVHRLIHPVGEQHVDARLGMRFRFTHVLYQNALYDALPRKTRWLLHRRVAKCLIAHRAWLDPRPGQLAAHFEAGLDFDNAFEHSLEAADAAGRLHADREAEQHCARALHDVEQMPRAERLAREIIALYNHGWVCYNLSDFERGRADFELMLARARELELAPDSPERAAQLDRIFAYLAQPWGDKFGTRQLPRMPNQPRSLGAPAIQCEALWALCVFHRTFEAHEALGRVARELLELAERSDNPPRRAEALVWIGIHRQVIGERRAARDLLERGLALSEALGHEGPVFSALHALGTLDRLEGDLGSALERHQRSLALNYEVNGSIRTRWNLGIVNLDLGELGAGLAQLEHARQMAEQADSRRHLILVLPSIAVWHRELGAPELALDLQRRSLELARAMGALAAEAHAAIELVETQDALSASEAAAQALHEAERVLARWLALSSTTPAATDLCRERLRLLNAQSRFWLRRGALDAAERAALALRDEAIFEGLHEPAVEGHLALADLALARGASRAARLELESACARLDDRPLPRLGWKVDAALARALLGEGRTGEASEVGRRAREVLERLIASLNDPSLEERWAALPALREVLEPRP